MQLPMKLIGSISNGTIVTNTVPNNSSQNTEIIHMTNLKVGAAYIITAQVGWSEDLTGKYVRYSFWSNNRIIAVHTETIRWKGETTITFLLPSSESTLMGLYVSLDTAAGESKTMTLQNMVAMELT